MTEQIYINGVQMDPPQNGVSLVFQSPFFTDIDNMTSSRTTAVDLPRTPNNLRAVGLIHHEPGTADFAYHLHKVVYIRDGVQVFTGRATLQSVTNTVLRFSFAWGNVSALQQLLGANLRDLQTEADYIGYDRESSTTDKGYYPDGLQWGGDPQPVLPVADIVARIEERFDVRLTRRGAASDAPKPFSKYHIPLVSRSADDRSRRRQGVEMGGTGTLDAQALQPGGVIPVTATYMSGPTSDINGMTPGTVIDVSEVDRLHIHVPAGFSTWIARTGATGGLRIQSMDETGIYWGEVFRTVPMTVSDAVATRYTYTTAQDEDIEMDVRGVNYVALVICWRNGTAAPPTHAPVTQCGVLKPKPIEIYDADRESLTFGDGAIFPLYRNLPDWSVSDLIKNLMKIDGLFAYAPDDKTVEFTTIGDLYANRAAALDWSGAVMTAGSAADETRTTFGNIARRNWFRWAEDDTVKGDYDGYFDVKDETLEASVDLVTVDFAPTDGQRIPVWVPTEDGSGLEWQDVEPRILKEQPRESGGQAAAVLSFDGMDWRTLIKSNYYSYRNVVARARALKVPVRLSAYELATFDATVPVYVRQWGHYYAVTKLTAKSDGAADAELLQLGTARTREEPPADEGGTEVKIKLYEMGEPGEGRYGVTLDGVDQATIDKYAADPQCRLVLMRHGYARRGLLGFKQDRFFGLIGTHTTRDKYYRLYRSGARYNGPDRYIPNDGKRYRIIGHDILKGGKLAGQTAKVARYASATLVFRLLQEVKLPEIPTGTAWVTRDGRLRNTAARGFGELYVTMVRIKKDPQPGPLGLETYGCECISNVLQVRGYTSNHKGWWTFIDADV